MMWLHAFQESLQTEATAGIAVKRGAESWQFFAFLFGTVFALAVTIIDEIKDIARRWPWLWPIAKLIVLTFCFYLFMLNHWMHNKLIVFLDWMKTENY